MGVVDKEAEAEADHAVGSDESFGWVGKGVCGFEGADGFLVEESESTGAQDIGGGECAVGFECDGEDGKAVFDAVDVASWVAALVGGCGIPMLGDGAFDAVKKGGVEPLSAIELGFFAFGHIGDVFGGGCALGLGECAKGGFEADRGG